MWRRAKVQKREIWEENNRRKRGRKKNQEIADTTKYFKMVEVNLEADTSLNVENAILLAFTRHNLHMFRQTVCEQVRCQMWVLGTGVTWHLSAYNLVESSHASHAVEASWWDSDIVSADRKTDLGTAVYAYLCECSISSTVKYTREYLYLFAFVKGFWGMETTETAVSWAGRRNTSQSVKDDPTSCCKFTWCGLHPSKPGTFRATHQILFTYSAQDFKSYQTLRRSIAQPTLGPTVISTTFRFVCALLILIKWLQFK